MGAAGAEAQRLGFIYKMPGVFYHTDKLSVIFCGKECCKRWFKENVSQETSEASKPQLEAMRKRMKNLLFLRRYGVKLSSDFKDAIPY